MITFDQVVTEVTSRLGNRADIGTRIGRWINYAFFEILMSPRFSFLELDKVVTFSTVPGTPIYSIKSKAADLWFIQNVRDNSNQRRIRQIHWQVVDDIQQTTGQPTRYAVHGDSLILDPIPDNVYTVQLRYRTRPVDVVTGGPVGQFVGLGTEWEEPIVVLSYIKGCEALEQSEKAQGQRSLIEGLLAMRQDVPMLEDEDSDYGVMPSIIYRQVS